MTDDEFAAAMQKHIDTDTEYVHFMVRLSLKGRQIVTNIPSHLFPTLLMEMMYDITLNKKEPPDRSKQTFN